METHFQECSFSDVTRPIDKTIRATNELLVSEFKQDEGIGYRGHFRTLLDHGPPVTK